jgi:dynein heavy chain
LHLGSTPTASLPPSLATESILSTQARTASAGGKNRDEILRDVSEDILRQMPGNFDQEAIQLKYPVSYQESMNTVLCQEVIRFQKLLSTITGSLKALKKALKGEVVMDAKLEDMANAIFDGKVPGMWAGKSYPSLKPLASYVKDFVRRLAFFRSWIDNGQPKKYWISGFFFTQARVR